LRPPLKSITLTPVRLYWFPSVYKIPASIFLTNSVDLRTDPTEGEAFFTSPGFLAASTFEFSRAFLPAGIDPQLREAQPIRKTPPRKILKNSISIFPFYR
jgi:hypothetical protein